MGAAGTGASDSRQTDSSLWPTVSVQGTASRSHSSAPPPLGTVDANLFQVSAPVSYELDVFGKLAKQREAADLDVRASQSDVQALAITMAAQVTEAWLDIVTARQRTKLLRDQIDVASRYLELTQLRLSQGLATALDVNSQQGDIYGLEARLEQALGAEQVAVFRLEALLGQEPTGALNVDSAELPELAMFPDVGVPATVLSERPDVQAAWIRLEAADARTAAAARNRLPTIRLSANVFLQASELGNLFDELFWSLAGQVTQPVFEGGRRDAAVDQSAAQAKERLYAYGSAVIRAIQEVQTAVVQEQHQTVVLQKLLDQQGVAQTALDLARERYRSGTLDYLRVLTSLRTVQAAEQSVLDARRQQFSLRVQTCRALGGSWTQDLNPPSEESP
ncbi:MAG: efflux transporter outer membrane subunit [bacterium]